MEKSIEKGLTDPDAVGKLDKHIRKSAKELNYGTLKLTVICEVHDGNIVHIEQTEFEKVLKFR